MLQKIRNAGFEISLNDGILIIEPVEKLTDIQQQFIRDNEQQLITEHYSERSEEFNMVKCEWCSMNNGKSRCNGRKLVFNDTWLRCNSYKFSGSYRAVLVSQPLFYGEISEHYHKHDRHWLMKKNLSLKQCKKYSENYLKNGRQVSNLSLLD